MTRWCAVPEICCATDRRTDGLKTWHIEVGAPPQNEAVMSSILHSRDRLAEKEFKVGTLSKLSVQKMRESNSSGKMRESNLCNKILLMQGTILERMA